MNSTQEERRPSLTKRFVAALRPKSSKGKLKKAPPQTASTAQNGDGKRLQYGAIYKPAGPSTDVQTGERADHTGLLHGLAHHESNESLDLYLKTNRGEEGNGFAVDYLKFLMMRVPDGIWQRITDHLDLPDAASLCYTSRIIAHKLLYMPLRALNVPENKEERNKFLLLLDPSFPRHLLCFECSQYHLRLAIPPKKERLKSRDIPNLVFSCPSITKPGYRTPRARLTPGNWLPYTFVQLVLRAQNISSFHGIPIENLSRRWEDGESGWSHQSRFYIHKGHLLMRVSSKAFAAPNLPLSGQRNFLYSREDYTPYFSACAHWRDGVLMDVCKCVLSHVPEDRLSLGQQLAKGPSISIPKMNQAGIVSLCSFCRPMRRCPECPSEYLVELKLAEDKEGGRLRQAMVVTRWADLGDGSRADGEEWSAVVGEGEVKFDSFGRMGKRAISGIFEAQNGVTLPGQRMLSLNPKGEKRGEEGHGWY